MRTLWISLCILVCSCDHLIPDAALHKNEARVRTAIILDEPFDLAYGGEAYLVSEDLSVRFDTVVADSRCPIDAICIWQGDAGIALTVRHAGQTVSGEIHSMDGGKSSFGPFVIQLTEMRPSARAGVAIDPLSYAVTLIVTKP